jgi:hypothetical protein
MPYAAENQISMSPIEGGVEITQEQYQDALAGIMSGQIVTIDGGFAVIDKPEPPEPEPEPEPEKTPQELLQEARENRQDAFQQEADPLFFKWQAGEGAEEAWQTKRAEIRARYPYPEDER